MKRLFVGGLAALISLATTAATLSPIQLLNPSGSTAGQAIVSTGASTPPAWQNITATSLAPVNGNTVISNATGASATPTAFSMPGCSGTNNALLWATNTGFTCGASFAVTSGNLSQFASTTSAQLAGVLSDETGTGVAVFSGSPALTGTPTAPTAATNTNTTQIASTAFVEGEFATPPAAGFGSTTARPVAATTLNSTTTNSTSSLTVTDTGTNGSNIKMVGNGATTPSKTLRVVSGAFGVVNDAYNSQILTLTDTGNLSVVGSITPSQTGGIVGTNTNNNANAGSVGEFQSNTTSATSLTSGTAANATSISLTAGDWDVEGVAVFNPQASTTINYFSVGVSTTSATYGATGTRALLQTAFTAGSQGMLPSPRVRVSLSVTTTVYLVASSLFGTSTMTVDGFIRARRVR